ncbi:MAG: 30S ribosomal protein S3 [bacterium]|nr:30S ribosomal protein S3 [bacterium]
MGQKTHPVGLRLGINRTWSSNWFDENDFAGKFDEDGKIRKYLKSRLQNASISRIEIERQGRQSVKVIVHSARPGVVIGRKGQQVDQIKEELAKLTGKNVALDIVEVRRPEIEAQLVADSIANQLTGKVSFRRAMKKAIQSARRLGAEGIKVTCSGRLGGAEMARTESYKEGRIPLHTLRAIIDFARSTSVTAYGTIGVKVWICKGEVFGKWSSTQVQQ